MLSFGKKNSGSSFCPVAPPVLMRLLLWPSGSSFFPVAPPLVQWLLLLSSGSSCYPVAPPLTQWLLLLPSSSSCPDEAPPLAMSCCRPVGRSQGAWQLQEPASHKKKILLPKCKNVQRFKDFFLIIEIIEREHMNRLIKKSPHTEHNYFSEKGEHFFGKGSKKLLSWWTKKN